MRSVPLEKRVVRKGSAFCTVREWFSVGVLACLSCGPSFEAIQEGGLRFAHCDRLDLDTKIAHSHRLHCWREWRRIYTYGQTRDRVDYARRRIAVLASGDTSQPFALPDPMGVRRAVSCTQACESAQMACKVKCVTSAAGCQQCTSESQMCRKRCG